MKLRTIVKIAITSSVVLLCSGFALYSFFRLSAAEDQKDFDLYTLVPSSVSAVFATEDVAEFVMEVDELTCSRDHQYLYVSKLFSYLKQSLYALSEDTPHGLSRQMNQMLISFHEPDNERNQVLYCRLGNGDKELVNRFVRKYISSLYPPKTFIYKGEEIIIYPMADGDFLACYLTSDFMALSFQKKLIENVIDAYKSGKSLADDSTFTGIRAPKKSAAAATIYTRMQGMMGWTEFDMKMKDDFIYFSGITHDADTCFAFINQLRQQQSVKGFPGEVLPSTAFYFSRQGITDWVSLLSYGNAQGQSVPARTSEVQNRDRGRNHPAHPACRPGCKKLLLHRGGRRGFLPGKFCDDAGGAVRHRQGACHRYGGAAADRQRPDRPTVERLPGRGHQGNTGAFEHRLRRLYRQIWLAE